MFAGFFYAATIELTFLLADDWFLGSHLEYMEALPISGVLSLGGRMSSRGALDE